MIAAADQNHSRLYLLLEVAFEAKVLVSLRQELVVNCSMRVMAGCAAFPDGFMLENKRPALSNVTLGAGVGLRSESKRSAMSRLPAVRVVAITATHLPVADRMVMRQLKAPFHFQVARETNFRIPVGIDDGIARPARLVVDATGTVATLTSHIFGVLPFSHETSVGGSGKMFINLAVAFRAGLGTDKRCSRNFRWHE